MYFLATFIEQHYKINVSHLLGLHLPQSHYWGPWQYVTHMFMHGSISHLFFNMFALFMFGCILESIWGSKRFLIFYFVCGIGAGALNSAIGWFEIQRLIEQYEQFQLSPNPNILAEVVKHQLSHPAGWIWETIRSYRKTNIPDHHRPQGQCTDDRGFWCYLRNTSGLRDAIPQYRTLPDVHSHPYQSQIFCIRIWFSGIISGIPEQCRRQRRSFCPFRRYVIRLLFDKILEQKQKEILLSQCITNDTIMDISPGASVPE